MKKPGPKNKSLSATHGGDGWQQRQASHAEDIVNGSVWRSCGVDSEYTSLREVVLAWPGDELTFTSSPQQWLMHSRPDLARIRLQAEEIARVYRSHGVVVHWGRPSLVPPPNFIFQRDLFFMTAEGALLCRPASRQRAGESRYAAEVLSGLGVPVLATPRGGAVFEGADALWLRPDTVLLGVGFRTNREGEKWLRSVLGEMRITVIAVNLPPMVQHLLGVVNFIDSDLAAVHGGTVTDEIRGILADYGVTAIELPPDSELLEQFAMNFVTLAPRLVVMPAGTPQTAARFSYFGVTTHAIDISEYRNAAGGLGCLTGILAREPASC